MKSKPETKCERIPREFCRKEACDPREGRDECYFRNQVVSEVIGCIYCFDPVEPRLAKTLAGAEIFSVQNRSLKMRERSSEIGNLQRDKR